MLIIGKSDYENIKKMPTLCLETWRRLLIKEFGPKNVCDNKLLTNEYLLYKLWIMNLGWCIYS